jgi:voltage-gated potassium channel
MADRPESPRLTRYLERRVERHGLRPRLAAAVIAAVWLIAVVVFGVAEHLIEPETFDNVWLGMWWATQTVTTVGYGDVVPDDAAGQVVATVLMLGGLSLFAVITGVITSAFVARAQAARRAPAADATAQRLDEIAAQLEAVRRELRRLSSREP